MIPYDFGDVLFPRDIREEPYSEPFFEKYYQNFCTFGYRAQIIGGHGTGKTTFLIEFVRYLEYRKHVVHYFTLHDGRRTLPREFWERQNTLVAQFPDGAMQEPPLAVVDGYEQLSLIQKMRLRRTCRKGRSGLLITTHAPAWRLPVLLRTETTDATLQYIIGHLFRDLPNIEPPDKSLCRALFDRHQGNLRNVLFDLYDHCEERSESVSSEQSHACQRVE